MTEDTPNPNKALLDEIHRLRGEFLSLMVDLEERLNHLIIIYFRVPGERRLEFTASVLSRMPFADKVEVVATITGAKKNTLKDLISALKRLNNFRNDVAHGSVGLSIGPGQTFDQALENWKWASTRWTRAGAKKDVLDVEALNQQIFVARAACSLFFTVMDEMAKAPGQVVSPDIDWRVRYNDSLDERGIPAISDALHAYFTEYGFDSESPVR